MPITIPLIFNSLESVDDLVDVAIPLSLLNLLSVPLDFVLLAVNHIRVESKFLLVELTECSVQMLLVDIVGSQRK